MFTSIKLGSPFGISVYIHPAFWLLPIFYLFSNLRATSLFHSILEVALLFAVFFCVILHEFGHALAARMFGICDASAKFTYTDKHGTHVGYGLFETMVIGPHDQYGFTDMLDGFAG